MLRRATREGHAPPLRRFAPPCRGGGIHPVMQFSDSWILTQSKFKSSDRKIKKNDNGTLVYWACSIRGMLQKQAEKKGSITMVSWKIQNSLIKIIGIAM